MAHGPFAALLRPSANTGVSRPPGNTFGRLVGEYVLATRVPLGGSRPDDNHIYLRLRVPDGNPVAGIYEAAVNIRSASGSGDARVQFTEREESVAAAQDSNGDGFSVQTLSYAEMALKEADFAPVQESDLYTLVANAAATSQRIAVYGHTYSDGSGIHDIHMNSGEPAGSPYPNVAGADGALCCYLRTDPKSPTLEAHWILLKFSTQTL